MDVHEVDLVKLFPLDLASIQITNPIGGEVRHFDFELVFARLDEIPDARLERQAPERADILAVQRDPRRFADVAQVQHPIFSGSRGGVEFDRILCGACEAPGVFVVACRPACQLLNVE